MASTVYTETFTKQTSQILEYTFYFPFYLSLVFFVILDVMCHFKTFLCSRNISYLLRYLIGAINYSDI